MVVDEIIRLLDYVKDKNGTRAKHPTRQRLFAALWGSLVFHLALWTYAQSHPQIVLTDIGAVAFRDTALMVLPVYSAAFGTIVAFGVTKGSLIRHFTYGVLLPTLAYGMAGTLISAVGGALGQ